MTENTPYIYIYQKRTYNIPVDEEESDNNEEDNTTIKRADVEIDKNEKCKASRLQISEIEEIECSSDESDTNTNTYNLRKTEARRQPQLAHQNAIK